MKVIRFSTMILLVLLLQAFTTGQPAETGNRAAGKKITRVWLIGDSTVADYSLEKDYQSKRYPIMGWGQVFQSFLTSDSLRQVKNLIRTDSVIVEDRARGGRSTRSFFEEGRWADVFRSLRRGDLVMIQFGHNDASVNKGERYTSLTGYKEFLRLYVNQSRDKGAMKDLKTPALLPTAAVTSESRQLPGGPAGEIYRDLEFAMPQVIEPQIPHHSVSITDFGAVGDGIVLNTGAFRKAIEAVSSKGGGTVVIPRGMWLTGPIMLKSNIRLHADEGALIVFSPDKSLYPLIETSFEGYNTVRCLSPIYGKDLENIAFTGGGVWDGSGDAWRPVKKDKLPAPQWKEIVKSGGVVSEDGKTWYPSEAYMQAQEMSEMNVPVMRGNIEEYENMRDFLRPVMVSLVGCKKIMIDGPVFQNSPAWCLHPLMCEDLTVRNITVRNPWYSQNGDGIDIESCRNVLLYDSNFDVGDDAICIKSGKNRDGRERGMPTENLVIRNCIVYHGHGGVTIGSEMSGGVRNVSASGCTFMGTDVGIRFKSNRGRGGVVENIWFSDILMTDIPTHAVSFNLYYGGLSVSEQLAHGDSVETAAGEIPPVTEETPHFRKISMKNIICRGAQQALYLQGLPELNLEDVTMENIDMSAENGLTCIDSRNITIKNLRLEVENEPALIFVNSSDVNILNFTVDGESDSLFDVSGDRSRSIRVEAVTADGKVTVKTFK